MPLTDTGKKVMGSMQKEYGAEKAKRVFYGSITKGNPGSAKWHRKSSSRKLGGSR